MGREPIFSGAEPAQSHSVTQDRGCAAGREVANREIPDKQCGALLRGLTVEDETRETLSERSLVVPRDRVTA